MDAAHYNFRHFHLVHDLASVLLWDFQLVCMSWFEDRLLHNRLEAPGRQEITVFFEARQARTERLLVGLLSRLHRWLLET